MTTGSGRELHHDGDEAFLRVAGRALLLALYAALRSLKLYPLENSTVQKALDDLQRECQAVLAAEGEIEVRLAGDFIFVNSTRLRLELDNFTAISHLMQLFRAFEVGVLRVHPGVERSEWQVLLSLFLTLGPEPPERRQELLLSRLGSSNVRGLELDATSGADAEDELRHAREQAKRTYSHGVAVTREVINSIRIGRTSNLKRAKQAVQMIVDQVLNNETSILGLTTLRDYDEYTFTHSVNVCIFAVALGRKIGLTKLQLYDLGMTALLHDVGKAQIPVDVLNKVGGLDEDEWTLIQQHPWRGALTLFRLRGYDEIPYRSILVAHEHHMKTDLTGYPRHVRPRELGIYSRIVAVADGFDAATTRRVYQTTPIEPDQVLREMWENPRRGYDPVVVKALINLIGIYPVGTCVVLDTFEVGIVASVNPSREFLHRPLVHLTVDPDGAVIPPPGVTVNLAEEIPGGGAFLRSIVKVSNPERYGIRVGDYFV